MATHAATTRPTAIGIHARGDARARASGAFASRRGVRAARRPKRSRLESMLRGARRRTRSRCLRRSAGAPPRRSRSWRARSSARPAGAPRRRRARTGEGCARRSRAASRRRRTGAPRRSGDRRRGRARSDSPSRPRAPQPPARAASTSAMHRCRVAAVKLLPKWPQRARRPEETPARRSRIRTGRAHRATGSRVRTRGAPARDRARR